MALTRTLRNPTLVMFPLPRWGKVPLFTCSLDMISTLPASPGMDRIVRDYIIADKPRGMQAIPAAYSEDETTMMKVLGRLQDRGGDYFLSTRKEGKLGSFCRICFPMYGADSALTEVEASAEGRDMPLALCRAIVKMMWWKSKFAEENPMIESQRIFYDQSSEEEGT